MSLLAKFELKTFDSAALNGTYQNIGSVTANPCYYAVLSNESNVGVLISIDGVNPIIRLSAGQILPLNAYTRHTTELLGCYLFKIGTQFSIKQVTAPGVGSIILNILTTG